MPKRKMRAAGYPRNSDPNLKDSPTLESQAKAIREYCEKEGYELTEDHVYAEAMSAYLVHYTERPKLMALLAAAKRREFDVLVVTEVRAIGRKQIEIFVIYDLLQKYGVRIETISEKFEDSAIGRFILATRAMVAEIERENTFARTSRGRKDRLANGNLPGQGKPAYGHIYIDTKDETNARSIVDKRIVYTDASEKMWSPQDVIYYMADLLLEGYSTTRIGITLTEMKIPTPRGGDHWQASTIHAILSDPRLIGKAYTNKWVKRSDGKPNSMKRRPKDEYVALPDGLIEPILVTSEELPDVELFERIQEQFAINRTEAWRNNKKHPQDIGIMRAGSCKCGICGWTMHVRYHWISQGKMRNPEYVCQKKTGGDGLVHHHCTTLAVSILDKEAWKKVIEILNNPSLVREYVHQLREQNTRKDNPEDIEATLATIKKQMHNLYTLAKSATDDDTLDTLTAMMQDLEKQKREAVRMLDEQENEEEEREKIEKEIQKFEAWAEKVRSLLTDPTYTPTYEEKRLAVRILGITALVYPGKGEYPFRCKVEALPPAIRKLCIQLFQ